MCLTDSLFSCSWCRWELQLQETWLTEKLNNSTHILIYPTWHTGGLTFMLTAALSIPRCAKPPETLFYFPPCRNCSLWPTTKLLDLGTFCTNQTVTAGLITSFLAIPCTTCLIIINRGSEPPPASVLTYRRQPECFLFLFPVHRLYNTEMVASFPSWLFLRGTCWTPEASWQSK